MTPRIALFIGDPAGVGPELVARLLAEPETTVRAEVLLIASGASMEAGMRAAGTRYAPSEGGNPALVHWRGQDAPPFPMGKAAADNGGFMLEGLTAGVALVRGRHGGRARASRPSTRARCARAAWTTPTRCTGSRRCSRGPVPASS